MVIYRERRHVLPLRSPHAGRRTSLTPVARGTGSRGPPSLPALNLDRRNYGGRPQQDRDSNRTPAAATAHKPTLRNEKSKTYRNDVGSTSFPSTPYRIDDVVSTAYFLPGREWLVKCPQRALQIGERSTTEHFISRYLSMGEMEINNS